MELCYNQQKYKGEANPTLTVADAKVQENANEWTITFNAEPYWEEFPWSLFGSDNFD